MDVEALALSDASVHIAGLEMIQTRMTANVTSLMDLKARAHLAAALDSLADGSGRCRLARAVQGLGLLPRDCHARSNPLKSLKRS